MKEITKKLLKREVYDKNPVIYTSMTFEDMLEYYEQRTESSERDFWKYLQSIWAIEWQRNNY